MTHTQFTHVMAQFVTPALPKLCEVYKKSLKKKR